jgi:Family of unknown function (DUF5662)
MYDSTQDTLDHVHKVQEYMRRAVDDLAHRAVTHDLSKFEDPEKTAWDIATPRLKETVYGSDEYRATLREIKPAVQHHYQENTHHPEHYEDGVNGMSLLDLIEMLCDWKAASLRTKDGDLMGSLAHNIDRFGIGSQLADVLRNTIRELDLA